MPDALRCAVSGSQPATAGMFLPVATHDAPLRFADSAAAVEMRRTAMRFSSRSTFQRGGGATRLTLTRAMTLETWGLTAVTLVAARIEAQKKRP